MDDAIIIGMVAPGLATTADRATDKHRVVFAAMSRTAMGLAEGDTRMDPVQALRRWSGRLLRRWPMTPSDEEAILSLEGKVHAFERRRDVVLLGRRTGTVDLVLDGLVGQFGQVRDGSRLLVGLRLPGEMANLQSAILPNACCALTALSNGAILRIPHGAILDLLRRSPRLGTALWGDCALDAAVSEQWMVNIARRSAVSRVAHLLCELALRYEALGFDRCSYRLDMVQADLADAVGLTSVHLNRKLRELRDAGIVDWRPGHVRINDWDKLTWVGDFDPLYLHLHEGARDVMDARSSSTSFQP